MSTYINHSSSTCLKRNFESSEACSGRCSCRKANWNSTENFENVTKLEACQHIFLPSKFSLYIIMKINFCVDGNFELIKSSDMKGNST